ncbi:unnamed protein product [Albugo candida]|uniref:Uncharacterized protein n=1 Tax=Albugo candida TaxID=65357 RepID=A0A024GMI4_9STRA|nr:unnamed protein product [Albugo candida]|eukprot:CCI47908.1 unnamed protein product [Albugo candida]
MLICVKSIKYSTTIEYKYRSISFDKRSQYHIKKRQRRTIRTRFVRFAANSQVYRVYNKTENVRAGHYKRKAQNAPRISCITTGFFADGGSGRPIQKLWSNKSIADTHQNQFVTVLPHSHGVESAHDDDRMMKNCCKMEMLTSRMMQSRQSSNFQVEENLGASWPSLVLQIERR